MPILLHEYALRKLQVALLVVTAIAFVGAAGYHFIEGWGWFESFYMVVTTLATVGYMEIHPLSLLGRAFNMFVIVLGVGAVFFSIGALTQTLMEVELDRVFGRRKMARDIEKIEGHYIICGAGRVGRSAAREFERNHVPFVIIESREAKAEEKADEWLTVVGDATQEKVLLSARIERARGIVAATTTDATNIYIVLTARAINPKLKIIARASEEEAEKHLKTAGADVIVSPYGFAGHRIAQSFLRPNVVDFLDIAVSRDAHEELVIEEVRVDSKSRLAGTTIGTSYIHRDMGIMVLAIRRQDGQPRFNPTANETIMPGDNLIVMGEAAKMSQLESVAAARTR
jgi:voltage-gated potassium channel